MLPNSCSADFLHVQHGIALWRSLFLAAAPKGLAVFCASIDGEELQNVLRIHVKPDKRLQACSFSQAQFNLPFLGCFSVLCQLIDYRMVCPWSQEVEAGHSLATHHTEPSSTRDLVAIMVVGQSRRMLEDIERTRLAFELSPRIRQHLRSRNVSTSFKSHVLHALEPLRRAGLVPEYLLCIDMGTIKKSQLPPEVVQSWTFRADSLQLLRAFETGLPSAFRPARPARPATWPWLHADEASLGREHSWTHERTSLLLLLPKALLL